VEEIISGFMRRLTKTLAGAILTLTCNVMAYVPDRCDWDDCGALARGESDGGGLGLLILFAIVLFIIAKSK
jgi:hypothetical protein